MKTANQNMSKISVIIPIYNVESYLDECINSIINQTYQNLEIILVDDGSKDNYPEKCDEWAGKDKRIKVIHKQNGGLSSARNAGLTESNGAFVSFIDSDDYISPVFFEKLLEKLIQTGADICECSIVYVDDSGNTLRSRPIASLETAGREEALKMLITENGVYQTVWNKLYTRQVIGDIFFKEGKLNEDEFWTYRIIDRSNCISFVHEELYFYRSRTTSIMGSNYSYRRLDGLQARFERAKYLEKYPELSVLCKQLFGLDCMYHLQKALRFLNQSERAQAEKRIAVMFRECSIPLKKTEVMNTKYIFWLKMFSKAPMLTAKVRNLLKIGI